LVVVERLFTGKSLMIGLFSVRVVCLFAKEANGFERFYTCFFVYLCVLNFRL
jgi:hypothetical protein